MYNDYIDVIDNNLKLDYTEWYLKKDKIYKTILEHVDEKYGYDYLEIINNEFNEIFNNNLDIFINLCNINDSIGLPIKIDFKNFCSCSPSNLRYIYQSLLILTHIKKLNINNIDIIEIGGGYGGLCFFINKLSYLYYI